MRRTETRQIGDYTFEITTLPLKQGMKVGVLLTNKLGPALSKFLGAIESLSDVKSGDLKLIDAGLSEGVSELARVLDDKDVLFLAQTFGKACTVEMGDKNPCVDRELERLFGGSLMFMLEWIAACIEVNFADFFDAARSRVGALQKDRAASQKPTEDS